MTRVVTVDVSDEEYAALKYLSVRYGKSIQDVIRDAIRDYVTKASLTLGTESWLQESLWELAAALGRSPIDTVTFLIQPYIDVYNAGKDAARDVPTRISEVEQKVNIGSQSHLALMPRCPYCGSEDVAPIKAWKFRNYDVTQYKCNKCGGKFNHYRNTTNKGKPEYTIRVSPKPTKAQQPQVAQPVPQAAPQMMPQSPPQPPQQPPQQPAQPQQAPPPQFTQ
jgi:DNA-directed RNA polymerase subunit RPC12/RpoP